MSLLKSVVTGRKIKPMAVLLHGVHGIGKSTFGAGARDPIFVGSEENDELDVARFPKVRTWENLTTQLATLRDEDHSYKTLVLDTVDSLEQVAQAAILSGANANKTMATAMGGYGKAYEKMRDMFLEVRDLYLIPIREKKGMNIILLAHSEKVKHEDPITNASYDHYQTAIHKKIKPVFEDWVSVILFANFELYKAERHDGKEYVIGDGERRIFSEERPSHVAKNRFELEYEFPLDFKAFAAQVAKHYKGVKKIEEVSPKNTVESDNVVELKSQITNMMADLPSETLQKVNTAFKRAKDDEKQLLSVKNRIEKLIA